MDKWTRLSVLALIVLSVTLGFESYQVYALSTSRNSIISPGTLSEAYCTHVIFFDGTNFFAKNCKDGSIDTGATTLSSELNTVIAADAVGGGGIEFVQNSGIITTGQWGTTSIALKATVKLDFEHGATYNIAENGDVFAGTVDSNAYYNLVFNSVFYLYNNGEVFLHLSNALDSTVYIAQIGSGSGSLLTTSRAVLLDGNPAYYNKIEILQMFLLDIGIYLPFVTVGANANILTVNYCQLNNYCIKIDQNVSDNFITRLVIGASGVQIAGLWIDGFSNHVESVYGEYSSGAPNNGPVLLFSTNAVTNTVYNLVQEGSDALLTDNAAIKSNLINTRFPALATRSVTAGASVYTFRNTDNTFEQIQITTLNGMTGWTCKGVTMINAVGQISPMLKPNETCLLTWATTAPVVQVNPL